MLHIYNLKTAKASARQLESFVAKLGLKLKHGEALDAVATFMGFQNWAAASSATNEAAIDQSLSPAERSHLKANLGNTYGEEAAVVAQNGFELRYDTQGEVLTYVRVCDPVGRETAYWDAEEWAEDPQLVMGAILGALTRGAAAPVLKGPSKVGAPTVAKAQPYIRDVPLHRLSNVLINDAPYYVEFLDVCLRNWREIATSVAPVEDKIVIETAFLEDGLVQEGSKLSLELLVSLKWDAERELFVCPQGNTYEFYLEQKFGASSLPATPASHENGQLPAVDETIELFEVTLVKESFDASGVRSAAEYQGVVAATSKTEAEAKFESGHGGLTRYITPTGRAAGLSIRKLDKDAFGPYFVFEDDGLYTETGNLSGAIEIMKVVSETAAWKSRVEDNNGNTVAVLNQYDES